MKFLGFFAAICFVGAAHGTSYAHDDTEVLGNELLDASDLTVQFLVQNIDENGFFNATGAYSDICFVYKAVKALFQGGRMREANRVLDYIKAHFLRPNGDIRNSDDEKTCSGTLNEYYPYTNGWILMAAHNMERFDISYPMYEYIKRYFVGFPTQGPIDEGHTEQDVFSIAHFGMIALNMGDLRVARRAGAAIIKIIKRQPDLDTGFYLRSNCGQIILDTTPFYFVSRTAPNQLHFFLGYPALFLVRLYEASGKDKYLDNAKELVDYAITCDQSIWDNHFAHKLAWAASNIARITGEDKYLFTAQRIASFLLSEQNGDGTFMDPSTPVEDLYDQSAEVSVWLRGIDANVYYRV